MNKVIAVTGGLGFIGRYVVDKLLERGDHVFLVDAETYAAEPGLLRRWQQVKYVKSDICDLQHLPDIDAIINLAAETHVDNSLMDNKRFFHSNVEGVRNLLELCRAKRNYEIPLFVQISTDEVYGSVANGSTDEATPMRPSSPYAASKAAADLLVQAWGHTYDMPYCIVRPSNCYGVGQYPEKLIPKAIRYAQLGKDMPIHEGGEATRSWLWVEDCADAILAVLDKGVPGQIYNVPGNAERSVIDVVKAITNDFQFGFSRMGLDKRYCVSGEKLTKLGWKAQGAFDADLPKILEAERSLFRW